MPEEARLLVRSDAFSDGTKPQKFPLFSASMHTHAHKCSSRTSTQCELDTQFDDFSLFGFMYYCNTKEAMKVGVSLSFFSCQGH